MTEHYLLAVLWLPMHLECYGKIKQGHAVRMNTICRMITHRNENLALRVKPEELSTIFFIIEPNRWIVVFFSTEIYRMDCSADSLVFSWIFSRIFLSFPCERTDVGDKESTKQDDRSSWPHSNASKAGRMREWRIDVDPLFSLHWQWNICTQAKSVIVKPKVKTEHPIKN